MKFHVSFNLYEEQLNKLNEILPSEGRNRSRFIRQFLKKEYRFPTDRKELLKLAAGEEEKEFVPYHIILDSESMTILNQFEKQLKEVIYSPNKSIIMRDVLNQYIQNGKPDLSKKRVRNFQLEKGTLEKLDEFIGDRDRSSTIDFFIKSEYKGPSITAEALKRRLPEKEQMTILLHESTLEKLDDFANQKGVKRAHIFRDVVNQFIEIQEQEKDEEIEVIKETLIQLEKEVPASKIREYIEKYDFKK